MLQVSDAFILRELSRRASLKTRKNLYPYLLHVSSQVTFMFKRNMYSSVHVINIERATRLINSKILISNIEVTVSRNTYKFK